jgi:small subunit ribosomal protein S5
MAEAQTQTPAASAPNQRGPRQDQRGPGGRGGNDRRPRRPQMEPEEKQFDERTLHIDRVARVVKGGRRFRFRALVVVGDRKTRVGIGMAKGADVTAAVTKATDVAKKNFITVSLYKGTLPHESTAKVGGANILIKPASAGTGLIAGGVIRTILEVAGVKNVLSKSLGSTNKANTAYATIEALRLLEPSKNWVTAPNRKQADRDVTKAAAKKVSEAKPAVAKKAPAKTSEDKPSAKEGKK